MNLPQAIANTNTAGYIGQITFDVSQSDGTPRKLMDRSRLNALGLKAQVERELGLYVTYQDFLSS